MIQSKDAYYMDIPKTATSYVENCLHHICQPQTLMYHTNLLQNGVQAIVNLAGKHYSLDKFTNFQATLHSKHGWLQPDNITDYPNKLFYTTIRNPWKYYVSEYHYSSITGFRKNLMDKHRDKDFEFLLKNVYTRKLKDGNIIGWLTNSIMQFTDIKFQEKDLSLKEIEQWFDETYFGNNLRKLIGITDNLGKEFCELVREHSDKFDLVEDYENKLDEIMNSDKTFTSYVYKDRWSNVNKIMDNDYKSYYNQELIDIVYNNDKMLIDRYNFKPEW